MKSVASPADKIEARPSLKKRPVKIETSASYSPPSYKTIEITEELQKLREKATRKESLAQVSTEKLEELLYILNQEKKSYAINHKYKSGLNCINTIDFVNKYYDIAKRKENQDNSKKDFSEINKQFEQSFKEFDNETKNLENDLIEKHKNKRKFLKNSFEEELKNFEEKWNSEKKQRLYNKSTNDLTVLRRQLSFLLVDNRFKEAEKVQKIINERTKCEQIDHYETMQNDYDASLRLLKEKQFQELQTFEENCSIEIELFRQSRKKLRQGYINRQNKLKTKEEILSDPNKLWTYKQLEKIDNNLPINTSSKMRISDIKEPDVTKLSLPPLCHKRSPKLKS